MIATPLSAGWREINCRTLIQECDLQEAESHPYPGVGYKSKFHPPFSRVERLNVAPLSRSATYKRLNHTLIQESDIMISTPLSAGWRD